MKILILGHNGMLGNTVYQYFKNKCDIITTEFRWPSENFKDFILSSESDFIINCIGAIPQKKYTEYEDLNVNLPIFLGLTKNKIIHPSTDCEFSGNLEYPNKYKKTDIRDAEDNYGKSKAAISFIIENGEQENIKILRTSIIGHEIANQYSLLEWFLNSDKSVNGFDNHYWNGVTTLFWCEIAEKMMNNWKNIPAITQIGTEGSSKFELLETIKKVYRKNISINRFKAEKTINKMLESDFLIPSIEEQLYNLKKFKNELR